MTQAEQKTEAVRMEGARSVEEVREASLHKLTK